MKRLLIICLSAALVSLAGCSDDEDIQPAQKEKIVSFLTGTHAPRLVAEENLEEGSDEPYFTTSGNAVYRYIAGINNPDRVNWTEVTHLEGDRHFQRLRLHLCQYRDARDVHHQPYGALLFERSGADRGDGRSRKRSRSDAGRVVVRTAGDRYARFRHNKRLYKRYLVVVRATMSNPHDLQYGLRRHQLQYDPEGESRRLFLR
ncbi:MAG: hypothetical protein ACLRM8_03720 [Alistipes sp.]